MVYDLTQVQRACDKHVTEQPSLEQATVEEFSLGTGEGRSFAVGGMTWVSEVYLFTHLFINSSMQHTFMEH